jgi:hypothetical protein
VVVEGRIGMKRCMCVDSVDIFLELLEVVLYFVMTLLMSWWLMKASPNRYIPVYMYRVGNGNDLRSVRPVNKVTAKLRSNLSLGGWVPCP